MMNFHRLLFCLGLFALTASGVTSADPLQQLPEVAKAMEKIVQKEKAFDGFNYQSHEVITIRENDRVPGLNGLMFVKYKNDAGQQIMLSIQWFEDKEDLLGFYVSNLDARRKQGIIPQRQSIDKNVLWETSIENGSIYEWTDAEHFAMSLGGPEVLPEILKAYLKAVPGRSEDPEEKPEKQKTDNPKQDPDSNK
jgi:hypothetical protein